MLVHISDLHFGRDDPAVAEALIDDLRRLRPSLIVNSGDLTQRARVRQFRAAQTYLRRLAGPQVTVPGNHDVPLYDVVRRFLSPLGRYRRFISPDLAPRYVDKNLAVLGINTARSLTWKNGRISRRQLREIEEFMRPLSPKQFKVVVTHHPFIPPPGGEAAGISLVGGAVRALEVLDRCGVDLLLAGHLHHGYTGDVRTFYPSTERSIVVAQAGTAISHRIRHEPNGYNVITVDGDRMTIAVRQYTDQAFTEANRICYGREGARWLALR